MTETRESLVFLGNECLSSSPAYNQAPILQTLLNQGYKIEALVIKDKGTRSRTPRQLAVCELAEKHDLNVVRIKTAGDLGTIVSQLQSRLAVLASFGLILRDEVLQHFPLGIINVHPSLLPMYRGPTPIEHAILNGDTETGISLMQISSDLDAGDIYAQAKLEIGANANKLSLTERLGSLAGHLIAENLPLILQQQLQPKPQNHDQATYCPPIKIESALDFRQHSAVYLQRHIQAFADCPNNKFKLNDWVIEIKTAAAIKVADQYNPIFYNRQAQQICVRCADGYLAISSLKPNNRKEMTAADFVNGFYRELLSRP